MYFVLLGRRSLAHSGHMTFGGQFSSTFDSGTTTLAGCFRGGCLMLRFVLGLTNFTKFFIYIVFHTLNIQMTLLRAIELYLHSYNPDIRFIFTVNLVDRLDICNKTPQNYPSG